MAGAELRWEGYDIADKAREYGRMLGWGDRFHLGFDSCSLWSHLGLTSISHATSPPIRFQVEFTSNSLRRHSNVTSCSLRAQVGSTSMSLRVHFGVTLSSRRSHLETLTSGCLCFQVGLCLKTHITSLRSNFDSIRHHFALTWLSSRSHFDSTLRSLRCHTDST